MNILSLNGSPRLNGNTNCALKSLEKMIAQGVPGATMTHVDLGTLALRPFTEAGCAITDDDMARVMDQVVAADVLILGTPVYWWGMSAQLKMVFDCLEARAKELTAKSKKVIMVTVGASPTDNMQYKLIKGQMVCITDYLKWHYVSNLAFSAFAAGELAGKPQVEEALKEAAEKLQQSL